MIETFFNDVVTFFSVFDHPLFITPFLIIFLSFPFRLLHHMLNRHFFDSFSHSSSDPSDDLFDVDEDLKKYFDYKL